jgi:hypothetical protein
MGSWPHLSPGAAPSRHADDTAFGRGCRPTGVKTSIEVRSLLAWACPHASRAPVRSAAQERTTPDVPRTRGCRMPRRSRADCARRLVVDAPSPRPGHRRPDRRRPVGETEQRGRAGADFGLSDRHGRARRRRRFVGAPHHALEGVGEAATVLFGREVICAATEQPARVRIHPAGELFVQPRRARRDSGARPQHEATLCMVDEVGALVPIDRVNLARWPWPIGEGHETNRDRLPLSGSAPPPTQRSLR